MKHEVELLAVQDGGATAGMNCLTPDFAHLREASLRRKGLHVECCISSSLILSAVDRETGSPATSKASSK